MKATLPLPPTANLYWRIWRGRAVTSGEARAYRETAALSAKTQGMRCIDKGDVSVSLTFYRSSRRGDLDNRIKVLLDSLRGVAFKDDAQVQRLLAEQHEDAARPRVEVWVRRMPRASAPIYLRSVRDAEDDEATVIMRPTRQPRR
jgi:crossover junction endodeoxyribonuclease RusA